MQPQPPLSIISMRGANPALANGHLFSPVSGRLTGLGLASGLERHADVHVSSVLPLLGHDRHADLIGARLADLGEGDLAAPNSNIAEHHVLIKELQS